MHSYEPFGKIAIKLSVCTPEDVEKALDIQRNLSATGREHKLIGMIMLEAGMISSAQLIDVLRYYEKRSSSNL